MYLKPSLLLDFSFTGADKSLFKFLSFLSIAKRRALVNTIVKVAGDSIGKSIFVEEMA